MSSTGHSPVFSIEDLLDGIDEFASEFVGNTDYHRALPKGKKIIHDPLWGTIRLKPWEVALLDLPLFQRLRQISQTSLVGYVFPGCNHTRFEHTLGVIQQTQRLVEAVNSEYDSDKAPFDHTVIRNLRLAALFHDCGHSCFSHISEDIYASCSDMQALTKDHDFPKCHPHEALSALILRSNPVRNYLRLLSEEYTVQFNVDQASNWIMGAPCHNDEKSRYQVQVINGPFDADKLDYIFRDAHYSGIPLGVDLYRLWAACTVSQNPSDDSLVLCLHQASVAPLEQILFSKINLFAIVYQHPKVRAAERMFQSVIEEVQAKKDEYFDVGTKRIYLNRATDFLWLTDDAFFSEALRRSSTSSMHKKIHDILYRRLFVRAITISRDTIEDNEPAFLQLRKLNQRDNSMYKARRELAGKICEKAGLPTDMKQNIWVDVPADPNFGEADRTFVKTTTNELRKISDLFPVQYWSNMFKQYKWRGHVFCPPEYQRRIYDASVKVFEDEYGLKFNKSARETAHVPPPEE